MQLSEEFILSMNYLQTHVENLKQVDNLNFKFLKDTLIRKRNDSQDSTSNDMVPENVAMVTPIRNDSNPVPAMNPAENGEVSHPQMSTRSDNTTHSNTQTSGTHLNSTNLSFYLQRSSSDSDMDTDYTDYEDESPRSQIRSSRNSTLDYEAIQNSMYDNEPEVGNGNLRQSIGSTNLTGLYGPDLTANHNQ